MSGPVHGSVGRPALALLILALAAPVAYGQAQPAAAAAQPVQQAQPRIDKLGGLNLVMDPSEAHKLPQQITNFRLNLPDAVNRISARFSLPKESPGLQSFSVQGRSTAVTIPQDSHMAKVDVSPDLKPCSSKTLTDCHYIVVYVKELRDGAGALIPAFIITEDGLDIFKEVLGLPDALFVMNGTPLARDLPAKGLTGWRASRLYRIQRFPYGDSCRPYAQSGAETLEIVRPALPPLTGKDNGIAVAPAKVFSASALRQMLAATSAQLATISGFNQNVIASGLTNIQGVTRDISYLSAQVTTTPTPTIASTTSTNATDTNAATTTTVSNTATTLNCPPGTLPGVGTSGVQACVPLQQGVGGGNNNGATSTLTPGTVTTGVSNTGGPTVSSNSTTTTINPRTGTVAPIPASTGLAPPNNVGLSSADLLAEQVQLNAQITTLRLLLQGAVSDQYLIRESHAVAARAQTTIGFNVTLNPPKKYKSAMADIRIVVQSPPDRDAASIMNLLPAEKTYNVAKVTSSQTAFGLGVILEPVNLGVSTGRSKDRLYLAKDADTVAVQFPPPGADPVRMPPSCASLSDDLTAHSVSFGWQFRPVLGAEYVEAGPRQVFAQIALPSSLGEQFAPKVIVQTRWRQYDPKKKVAGPVYDESCSVSEDSNPIAVVDGLRVDDVRLDDIGGGILKIAADGEFFASGFAVLTGPTTIIPATFDGGSLQFFAPARDLILNGDLRLVSETGKTVSISLPSQGNAAACGITQTSLKASPHPDGKARLFATFNYGTKYKPADDGEVKPFILVGGQVFGLRETPFLRDDTSCSASTAGYTCKLSFTASADALSTRRFTIRDLAWKDFTAAGTIQFEPSFSGLSLLSTPSSGSVQAYYTLTGQQFERFSAASSWSCTTADCLRVFQGSEEVKLDASNFQVTSTLTAVLGLPSTSAKTKSIRIVWSGAEETVEWSLAIPEETKPSITASPSLLSVSDSRQVTFTNVDVPGVASITFDGGGLGIYDYDPAKKTLKVQVPASVTATGGHKELILTKPDGKLVLLPIEVRR